MRNVSIDFLKSIEKRRDFYYTVNLQFADGRTYTLSPSELANSDFKFTECCESNAFPIGIAICKTISFSLINDTDQWSEYDFAGLQVVVKINYKMDNGTIVTLSLGKFTVVNPETYGSTIQITALDDMYKTNVAYTPSITFPATVKDVIIDVCRQCDIPYNAAVFNNDDYMVKAPDSDSDVTCRNVLGYMAMIAGSNCKINSLGYFELIPINFQSVADVILGKNGGTFDTITTPYSDGDNVEGGDYTYNDSQEVDGGQYTDLVKYHVLYNHYNLTIAVDDVVITGISFDYEDEDNNTQTYLYGEEGYVLKLTNPMLNNVQNGAGRIGSLIVGLRFRPFTSDYRAYPITEVGDCAIVIDMKNRQYVSIITDVEYDLSGGSTIKCQADNPIRNSSNYTDKTSIETAIKTRNLINQRTKSLDDKMTEGFDKINEDISNASGFYKTDIIGARGETITYYHNKPNLEESNIQWRFALNVMSVSTDFGATWNAAINAEGDTFVRYLQANGISAIEIIASIIKSSAGNNPSFYLNGSTGEIRGASIYSEAKAKKGKLKALLQLGNFYNVGPVYDGNGNFVGYQRCTIGGGMYNMTYSPTGFNDITSDSEGASLLYIGSSNRSGAVFTYNVDTGKPVVKIGATELGGNIDIYNKDDTTNSITLGYATDGSRCIWGVQNIYGVEIINGYAPVLGSIGHSYTLLWGNDSQIHFFIDDTDVAHLSDSRIKKNIRDIESGYKDAVLSVDLKQFQFNRPEKLFVDYNKPQRFGAIAQDVIKALEDKGIDWKDSELVNYDVVNTETGDERYSINYVPFLITRLAADEDRISKLESEVQELKELVNKLINKEEQ